MTHSELRIGNLIWYRDKKIVEVSNLGNSFETTQIGLKECIPYGSDDIEEYNPVVLTEEILIRSGCMKSDRSLEIERFKLVWRGIYKFWYVIDSENDTYMTKVEYLHEWQNFYFIMQGKELKTIEL